MNYWKDLEKIKVAKPTTQEVIGRKPRGRSLKYFLYGYEIDDHMVQTIPFSYVNISNRPVPENHDDVENNPWAGPQEIEFTWLDLSESQRVVLMDELILSTDILCFGILRPEIDFPCTFSMDFLEHWTLDVQQILSIYNDEDKVSISFRYITTAYRNADLLIHGTIAGFS